jgi:hypothetical protein
MLINNSAEAQIIKESPTAAGSTRRTFGIQSDAVLMGLSVPAISGTLSVALYALVDGQQALIVTFPLVSVPTTSPLLIPSPITTSSLMVEIIYTGACTYAVTAKATGSGSSTIAGSVTVTNFPVTQPVSGTVSVSNLPAIQDVNIVGGITNPLPVEIVDNIRQQILKAADRDQLITYASFGTKDQRVIKVEYTSPTVVGYTARKTLSYTLVGTKYRRDSIEWEII